MPLIETGTLTDKALEDYDRMMIDATIKIENFATLAFEIWKHVLRELDKRGKIKLISGTYDDLGNALITRAY